MSDLMADNDVADMKRTENQDLQEQQGEKPLAEAKGDTEAKGGEESAPAPAAAEEE